MPSPARLQYRSGEVKTVSVAGDFNDWCGSTKGRFDPGLGRMNHSGNGLWTFPLSGIPHGNHQYKFVVDGEWESGPNRTFFLDERGRLIDPTGGITRVVMENPHTIRIHFNAHASLPKSFKDLAFTILPHGTIDSIGHGEGKGPEGEILILTCRDIDLSESLRLEVRGLTERPVLRPILLDELFQHSFISNKPLGVTFAAQPPITTFRLFAPRARNVTLKIFADADKIELRKEAKLYKDTDGVWETRLIGTWWGSYYGYHVEGPTGDGEGFDPKKLWPDPYCHASLFHHGPSILVEPGTTGGPFRGWADDEFRTPARADLVIWEASMRDLTSHASANVPPLLRGKYQGLISTIGKGTGIDHAKALGINAIEFLPIYEYDDDPPGSYHWGYMPSLFFAPEASYASNPYGCQVHEFKAVVNALHQQGIAVILDVVYNHTGAPQVLMGLDKKYFFRFDGNLVLDNFSGCGNDFKSEMPMARRIVLDSLEHWVREYHVDGFRFDLAELLDLETLRQAEHRLKPINPNIILIAEPWSFRGSNKGHLKNTQWTSWNDDFRSRVKDAALGRGNAASLAPVLKGSLDLWTAAPQETVNYVESHDNYTLTDHLTQDPDHDGSRPTDLDIRRNLFCAAATLLSPGIPMLAQGQEMLRTKRGNENSYNAGDGVNAVDYTLRNRYPQVFAFYRDLIAFRRSADGAIIRHLDAETCRQAEVVPTQSSVAVGFRWQTTPRSIGSGTLGRASQMLVLFNADNHRSAIFTPRLSSGVWVRRVGEGKVFDGHDPFAREVIVTPTDGGTIPIEVPPLGVEVWMPRPVER